jgi:hypothetical protein
MLEGILQFREFVQFLGQFVNLLGNYAIPKAAVQFSRQLHSKNRLAVPGDIVGRDYAHYIALICFLPK